MKPKAKILFLILLSIMLSNYSEGFINNLSITTNSNIIIISWETPSNYTESTLYYNIYSSKNQPTIKNQKISGIEEFELLGTLRYSSTNTSLSFSTTTFDRYYIIIPVTNGKSIVDWISNIIPTPNSAIEQSKITTQPTQQQIQTQQTNLPKETILISQPKPQPQIITQPKLTNSQENSKILTLSPNTELGYIIKNFFLKRDYKTSLEKLNELFQITESDEEKDLIKIYTARCYYAINKKRKAIYILLSINSEEVKPLAEFWLNRYSRYFFNSKK